MKSLGYLSVNWHKWVHQHWHRYAGVGEDGAIRARGTPTHQALCVANRSHNIASGPQIRTGAKWWTSCDCQNMFICECLRSTPRGFSEKVKGDGSSQKLQNTLTWLYSVFFLKSWYCYKPWSFSVIMLPFIESQPHVRKGGRVFLSYSSQLCFYFPPLQWQHTEGLNKLPKVTLSIPGRWFSSSHPN